MIALASLFYKYRELSLQTLFSSSSYLQVIPISHSNFEHSLTSFTDLVKGRQAHESARPRVLPTLHIVVECLFACPSGPALAQFLMVTVLQHTLFHQFVGLVLASGEEQSLVFFFVLKLVVVVDGSVLMVVVVVAAAYVCWSCDGQLLMEENSSTTRCHAGGRRCAFSGMLCMQHHSHHSVASFFASPR